MKPTILIALLVVMPALSGCDASSSSSPTSPPLESVITAVPPLTESGTVVVEIHLPQTDNASQQAETTTPITQRFKDTQPGTTVESLMRQVSSPKIAISGSGQTAFLQSIGDHSTNSGQGWTYTINGEFQNTGIGVTPLTPPATVTWKYGDWEDQ